MTASKYFKWVRKVEKREIIIVKYSKSLSYLSSILGRLFIVTLRNIAVRSLEVVIVRE